MNDFQPVSAEQNEQWRTMLLRLARQDDAIRQSDCRPPSHEVVEWHLTYVAEAYLPSHTDQLTKQLKRAGWADVAVTRGAELVPWLRGTIRGGGWTTLAELLPESSPPAPYKQRATLPDGVARVRLSLMSITSSLTMMSAAFEWNDEWAQAMDQIAKTDYHTVILDGRQGYTQLDPFFYKQMEVRRRRRIMRRHVSSWLSDRFPGAFRELGAELPTIDVITSAWSRPFSADPPLKPWDYREALGLDRRVAVASSASLPEWRLLVEDVHAPNVLTLAGRTAEVFDESVLGSHLPVSRSGLDSSLWFRGQDQLLTSWTIINLLARQHSDLASTRDRAPAKKESAGKFARRLSRDVDRVLRRGTDAGAVCSDLLAAPDLERPLRFLGRLDFTVETPSGQHDLGTVWTAWLTDQAQAVQRLEHDQREWLSASAGLSGLSVNIRLQRWLGVFAVAAIILAGAAIWLAVLQLDATRSSGRADRGTVPAVRRTQGTRVVAR